MAEPGPVDLVLGRSTNVMVVDDMYCFFTVLARVEWVSVELIGCKTRSRLQREQDFCNFLCNFNVVCNPRYRVRRAPYHSQNEWYGWRIGVSTWALRRNQYCNLGCKSGTTWPYTFVLQLFMQPYSKAKNNKEKDNAKNTKNRTSRKIDKSRKLQKNKTKHNMYQLVEVAYHVST